MFHMLEEFITDVIYSTGEHPILPVVVAVVVALIEDVRPVNPYTNDREESERWV